MTKHTGFTARALALPALLFLITAAPAPAQFGEQVLGVSAGAYTPGAPLPISIDFTNLTGIRGVNIAYRLFGQGTYTVREMQVVGNTALYMIPPAELRPAILEYWFRFIRSDGGSDTTYPFPDPMTQPLTADLGPAEAETGGLTILGPEPGEHLNRTDLLISFSIDPGDTLTDRARTRVLIDGDDLSEKLVVTGGLFVLRPENAGYSPDGGPHTITVELFDRDGRPTATRSWGFFVRGPRERAGAIPPGSHAWETRGTLRLETRNETIRDRVTPYNRATLDASSTDGTFTVDGHLHLTTEEKAERQPQNRFFIGAESPWVRAGYGDTYPVMPDMIISGKRVRGFSGGVSAGFFDFDVVAGDVTREVERDSQGTFSRNMLILRPSFNFGNGVFGLTALHSKDDLSSVAHGGAPEENLVAGTDLLLSFDRKNIELRGQAGFSLYNSNIRGGNITDARIDSIFTDGTYTSFDAQDLRDARDIFSRFITVNENLVPLGAKNTPTLSYEGSLDVNYAPNNFTFSYLRHGASYVSFGQPFFRKDIRGFSVNDRLRLVDNRLLLSAGLERLQDNTGQTKAAVTTYTTLSGGLTYLTRNEAPNVTLGVSSLTNENPLDPASPYSVDDRTLRFMIQLSRQVEFGARHFASITLSTSNRDDMTARGLDSRNLSLSFNAVTTYSVPLRTTVSAMFFSTEIDGVSGTTSDVRYWILTLAAQYRLAEDRLLLNSTVSPTLGDIRRTLLNGGLRYFFLKNLSLEGGLNLYFNKDADTDVIWSFVLRSDI